MNDEEEKLLGAIKSFIKKMSGGAQEEQKTTDVVKSVDEDKKQATFLVLKAMSDETDPDLHGDVYYEEDVSKACHSYNTECMQANLGHLMMVEKGTALVLESYLAPVDFQLGDTYITKGSWLQVWQFANDDLWGEVKKGYWNGLSIQCTAEYEVIEDD